METIILFWRSLSATQRTIVIVGALAFLGAVLFSFIMLGTDYSGFGDWLLSWRD